MRRRIIKQETIITEENYRAFNRVHYRFVMRRKKWWFLLVVLLTIPIIYLYFTSFLVRDYFWGTFFIILDIIILLENATTIIPDLFTKRFLKANPNMIGLHNIYEFHDDYFYVTNQYEEAKVAYHVLQQVLEVEDYFYAYCNTQMAYVIGKEGLTEKQCDDLRNYFSLAVGKKYYKRKR